MKTLLRAHVAGLQAQPQFAHSWFIFLPENNLGLEASHLAKVLSKVRNVYTFSDNPERVGVSTTNARKFGYVSGLEDYLIPPDCLRFNAALVCANPFLVADVRVPNTRKKLHQQLGMFRKMMHLPTFAYGQAKTTLSGKVDPEGKQSSRFQDDLVMALMIAVFWGRQWHKRSPKLNVPFEKFK